MNPTDIVEMLEAQCLMKTKKPDTVLKISESTIKLVQTDDICNLDQMTCALSYLHKPTEQTTAVCGLLERQLQKFDIKNNMVVEPKGNAFKHAEIQNLIFPNLHHVVFEFKVKSIFRNQEKKLLEPMQRHIFEDRVLKQNGYNDMQNIKPFKNQPKFESLEHLRENSSNQLTKSEGNTLEMLLKNLISQHSNQTRDLETALIRLTADYIPKMNESGKIESTSRGCLPFLNAPTPTSSSGNSCFLFAPVKGFERCLVKLKEQIQKDPHFKFPLYTLKDISRCSFVFDDARQLVDFFNDLKAEINNSPVFSIQEVKNMFSSKGGGKQSYKDVKLVCSFQASTTVKITFEIQLILIDILRLKKTLHKFYDITRTNFTPLRNEYYQLITERIGEMAIKNKVPEYGEGNIFFEAIKPIKSIRLFIKECIEKGTYIKEGTFLGQCEYIYEFEGNTFTKIGGKRPAQAGERQPKEDESSMDETEDEEAIYSLCPFGNKNMSEMMSCGPEDESEEWLLIFLYRAEKGETKTVYEQEGYKFKINSACIRMGQIDDKVNLEQQIFRTNENGEEQDADEHVWKLVVDSDGKSTTEFNMLVYDDGEFNFRNVPEEDIEEMVKKCDYIREFDIQVGNEKELDKSDDETSQVDVNQESDKDDDSSN